MTLSPFHQQPFSSNLASFCRISEEQPIYMSRTYESIPGFFVQDDPNADPIGIGALPPRFGLIDSSPERWTHLRSRIAQLNQDADDNTYYKVFFFGRHGEGFHNVGEAKYGTLAWDNYWAKLNGDDEITWGPDPQLTALGESQARAAHDAWESELESEIPLPEKLYCSPLTRALRTAQMTFDGILTDENRKTVIVENCREEYGEHTCDKRKTRTYLQNEFPRFEIEDGFTEEDNIWTKERETRPHVAERARAVLDRIFQEDAETFISITAHGGIINGFLTTAGRQRYALPTGGVLPVVIKSVIRP